MSLAASDDESDSAGVPDMIPAKTLSEAGPETGGVNREDAEDGAESDDPDEYRVEKIVTHGFTDEGVVLYQIKWLGYDDDEDLTWEPLENLDGAKDLLNAYHKKIGGKPVYQAPSINKKKKKGTASRSGGGGGGGKRAASEAFTDSPAPESSKRRGRSLDGGASKSRDKRDVPLGSWEEHVLRVTSILEETMPARGNEPERRDLVGVLEWKDGPPKTQHKMKVLRQKVPQRLLDYLLQHLVFTQTGNDITTESKTESKIETKTEPKTEPKTPAKSEPKAEDGNAEEDLSHVSG